MAAATDGLFGRQLAAARVLVGLSLEQVARQAGIDEETLARMEEPAAAPPCTADEIARVRAVLERAGAVFIAEDGGSGAGVRLKFTRQQTRQIGRWEDEGGLPAEDDVP